MSKENFCLSIGLLPKVSADNLKAIFDVSRHFILDGTGFHVISGFPSYPTVARHVAKDGYYQAIIHLDSVFSQSIAFTRIQKIEADEK